MGFRTRFTERTAQGFLLAILVSGLSAQISETRPQIGVPEDWTHHRIRFSSAKLREHPELAAGEPRAAMQLYRQAFMQARAAMGLAPAAQTSAANYIWSASRLERFPRYGPPPAGCLSGQVAGRSYSRPELHNRLRHLRPQRRRCDWRTAIDRRSQ